MTGPLMTMVRVHLRNTLADMIGAESDHFGWPLKRAMKRVAEEGSGVIVVLRKSEASRDLVQQIINLNRAQPLPADDHPSDPRVLRTYGIGAQILVDLGVGQMRLMTNNPAKYTGLGGYGLEIVERVPVIVPPNDENVRYLRTKQEKMGHILGLA